MDKTLPNLIIPGVSKSGTTSLKNYLNQHPDIYIVGQKEIHFFTYNYSIGKKRFLMLAQG